LYRIRLLGPEDHALQRELLCERLPREDIDKRLGWIYRGNPAGPGHSWVAFDPTSGEPAGMTTFFPRRMWAFGRELAGAIGGDMYVRPKFRRRGIGAELFRVARGDMERLGVELMFGTPMPPNVSALLASGSSVPKEAVVRLARIVHGLSSKVPWLPRPAAVLIERLLAPRKHEALRLERVTGSDARIDALWAETRGELAVATVRDAAFYRWRFVDAPSQVQHAYVVLDRDRPIAACALECVKGKLRIVDLLAPRARWRRALQGIAGALDGQSGIEMRLARADAQNRRLWTSGLLARETMPMSMLTIEGVKAPPGFIEGLHDPTRWYITWADTDIDHA